MSYHLAVEDPLLIAGALEPLMRAFARETSREIQWEAPTAREVHERGDVVFTVRHDGELVGFCLARLDRDGASDAGMFLAPDHRRGWLAVRLAKFVQGGMKRLGARWMTWECDEASRSFSIAEHLGHKMISRRYYVALGEAQ